MKNDRVRRLNAELLNNRQNYLDNEKIYNNKIINSIHKIRYEYFSRFKVFLKEKNKIKIQNKLNYNNMQSENFKNYFRTSLNNILNDDLFTYNAKRTAITINDVLLFLKGK